MRLLTRSRWGKRPDRQKDDAGFDDDVAPLFAILWIGSLGRVVAALIGRETFGTELTLAVLAVVFLPLLMAAPLRRTWQSLRRRPSETPASDEKTGTVVKLAPRGAAGYGAPR